MSLNGNKPIMVHQRMDFFLLAFDQLINNAAKWNFMFGYQKKMSAVIRLIVGKGWGQGPTHSQNFQSLFANIPGIKVVAPSLPSTVKPLLEESYKDDETVLFIEHRWLHNVQENFKRQKKLSKKYINNVQFLNKGNDITLVSWSISTIDILKSYNILKKNKISFDHIDLVSLKPLNIKKIYKSVKKTGKLIILDNTSHEFCSIGSEIISSLTKIDLAVFSKKPIILTLPDYPTPTSYYLTKTYYKNQYDLFKIISHLTQKKIPFQKNTKEPHDVPDKLFKGPF
jgi:pyruvate/2-oxoglutarate/acetoin dehydrogenase E1 component